MGKDGDILLRDHKLSISAAMMRLGAVLVGIAGVLECLSGAFVAGLVVLLFMGLSSNNMGMCSDIVHFRRSLMVLVA